MRGRSPPLPLARSAGYIERCSPGATEARERNPRAVRPESNPHVLSDVDSSGRRATGTDLVQRPTWAKRVRIPHGGPGLRCSCNPSGVGSFGLATDRTGRMTTTGDRPRKADGEKLNHYRGGNDVSHRGTEPLASERSQRRCRTGTTRTAGGRRGLPHSPRRKLRTACPEVTAAPWPGHVRRAARRLVRLPT